MSATGLERQHRNYINVTGLFKKNTALIRFYILLQATGAFEQYIIHIGIF